MVLPLPDGSRVVLIGASRFTDSSLADLPAVRNNLDGLASCFQDPALWGLPPAHCVVVRDPVYLDDLIDPVHDAASEAEDTLIVYYSGHGLIDHDTNELLLALVNSRPGRSHKSVPYEYVRRDVSRARAKRRVVILDCCYSGKALGGMSDASSVVADQASADGTYLLASAPPNQQALSPPGEHFTAFTGELVSLLRGGLPDAGPELSLDTVYKHIYFALRDRSRPEPQRRAGNTAGDLALARNRRWQTGLEQPVSFGLWEPQRETEPLRASPREVRERIVPILADRIPIEIPVRDSMNNQEVREVIKATVRERGMDLSYRCPTCTVPVTGRNLVRHFDKHTQNDPPLPAPSVTEVRERIKTLVRDDGLVGDYACPVCKVTVAARNLVRHIDKHDPADLATLDADTLTLNKKQPGYLEGPFPEWAVAKRTPRIFRLPPPAPTGDAEVDRIVQELPLAVSHVSLTQRIREMVTKAGSSGTYLCPQCRLAVPGEHLGDHFEKHSPAETRALNYTLISLERVQ